MQQGGRDLGQRDENEAALVHRRVRDVDDIGMYFAIVIEKDVEIDGARALGACAFASHCALDIEQ